MLPLHKPQAVPPRPVQLLKYYDLLVKRRHLERCPQGSHHNYMSQSVAILSDASSTTVLSVLQQRAFQCKLAIILQLLTLQVLQRMAGQELEGLVTMQLTMLQVNDIKNA